MIYYSNKCFFQGIFKNGLKLKGFEVFPNGNEYIGDYQMEKFNGKGILKGRDFKYEGFF